jgi:hypothetical protein
MAGLLHRASDGLFFGWSNDSFPLCPRMRKGAAQAPACNISHWTEVRNPVGVGTPVYAAIATDHPVTLQGLPTRRGGRPLINDAPDLDIDL